jgi:serine/threonine protein kinase
MVEAVSSLHQKRIIHADLKPEHFVLVNDDLKLVGFTTARKIDEGNEDIFIDKKEAYAERNIDYMAPENFILVKQERKRGIVIGTVRSMTA